MKPCVRVHPFFDCTFLCKFMAQFEIKICCFDTLQVNDHSSWLRQQIAGSNGPNIEEVPVNLVAKRWRTDFFLRWSTDFGNVSIDKKCVTKLGYLTLLSGVLFLWFSVARSCLPPYDHLVCPNAAAMNLEHSMDWTVINCPRAGWRRTIPKV